MNNLLGLPIGIMQGRLLPKYLGRYQAHPLNYWKDEFPIASDIGLDCIEFILDFNDYKKNPLIYIGGVKEIKETSKENSVNVKTICADYFMDSPLHIKDKEQQKTNIDCFLTILHSAKDIGIKDIVLPCVDNSSIQDPKKQDLFLGIWGDLIEEIKKNGVRISLETDLGPKDFSNLLDKINSDFISVNYDTGNSASLGYDPVEEFIAYGSRISDIHIKDRVLGGGPIELGKGNVDFKKILTTINNNNYKGPLIFQAYRDEQGVDIFKKQYHFFMNEMKHVLN